MSLPRSYTLPREFKFSRQGRKIIKNEHFVANEQHSSDGESKLSAQFQVCNFKTYQATLTAVMITSVKATSLKFQSGVGEQII